MTGISKRCNFGAMALAASFMALGGCNLVKEDQADATVVKEETPAAAPAATPVSTEFSVESVPVTTATLPPVPFFSVPAGLKSIYDDNDKIINFGEQWFIAGEKPVKIEGKIYRDTFPVAAERKYTDLEFRRNYENAILALGGKKINTVQWMPNVVALAGGLDAIREANLGQGPDRSYPHDDYLIRTADKEYWISVSLGSFPRHGTVLVLEKQAMKQSVGFLDASAMKKAIDADGKVALQINFDVDKATIRPDGQPILDEINKLLAANPALKLSIDGHTDNTGDAAHNRTLSTARARSVLGALVGLGIDPARLKSRGFGPDKPVADNATDAGRAKNRRVELVKI